MVDYRKETNGIATHSLKGQKLKKFLKDHCIGYKPTPYVSPVKQVENKIKELYDINAFEQDEIINSLAGLLAMAMKASGIDSKTIKGANHTITVKVEKNDNTLP